MKIALFDDERHWRNNLSFILEDEGFQVRAFDSIDAAAANDAKDFDVVISDYKFPESAINGLDFLTKVRVSGFAGPLILYSNTILDSYRPIARRSKIALATKAENIEMVVRSVLAPA